VAAVQRSATLQFLFWHCHIGTCCVSINLRSVGRHIAHTTTGPGFLPGAREFSMLSGCNGSAPSSRQMRERLAAVGGYLRSPCLAIVARYRSMSCLLR
jgi:hypothetical protein